MKYGYSAGWLRDDWEDECSQKLYEHLEKGDPRDVANFCTFMWHHGWATKQTRQPTPQAQEEPECERCQQLMELRRDEGERVRRAAFQLLTTHQLGKLQAELYGIADGLECGNPLGDCGCEGTCFTCGDCERCVPAAPADGSGGAK